MKITQKFCTENQCYQVGKSFVPKGLTLHSVGCNQPSAEVFARNFNSYQPGGRQICVHGFIDANSGEIIQTLPWTMRGWHGGSGPKGSVNDIHIGVEMCEPGCIKYTGTGANFTCSDLKTAQKNCEITYNSAVELFAYLCKKFGLDPLADGVIISHSEGNKRGIASNHGDPEHLWNGLKMPYTMDTFRAAVAAKIGNDKPPDISENNSENFLVRVIDPALNIRENPGVQNKIVGVITDCGVYTITETKPVGTATWGKLKSGAGWINIGEKYCRKI